MDEELPNEFDLVVVGTGFSESIVAAAASRIGKTVLHLDPNEFYGGMWASFNLDAFQNFLNKANVSKLEDSHDCCDDDDLKISENCCNITNITQKWHIDDNVMSSESTDASENENETNTTIDENFTKEKILKDFRKFNIDLIPKILYGNGKLVKLLISSNICRYAEFRAIDRIVTLYNGEIKNVPCTRNDVFNSNDLNIIEKRLLMKLLTNCMNYGSKTDDEKIEQQTLSANNEGNNAIEQQQQSNDNFQEYENKTFLEYLKGQKMTDKIIHCVLYSISMSNEKTSLIDGIEKTKKFLNSLGRYGNTPFLFPMYGCGEIPQDFCRLCAVFGGIYCLKRSIDGIDIEPSDDLSGNRVTTIKCNGQNIKIKNLLIGSNNIPKGLLTAERKENKENDVNCGELARAVFITAKPIGDDELNSGGGGVNIMRLSEPGDENLDGAFIIQLSHYSGTCPKGLYLIHIITKSRTDSPENDLKPFVIQIFKESDVQQPIKILYSAYFMIKKCQQCECKLKLLTNCYTTCGPFYEYDYDKSIDNAYDIFKQLYPNDEFLPRAPDPEEIIIGDEDPLEIQEQINDNIINDDMILTQCKEAEENDGNIEKQKNDDNDDQVKCITENKKNEQKDCNEQN